MPLPQRGRPHLYVTEGDSRNHIRLLNHQRDYMGAVFWDAGAADLQVFTFSFEASVYRFGTSLSVHWHATSAPTAYPANDTDIAGCGGYKLTFAFGTMTQHLQYDSTVMHHGPISHNGGRPYVLLDGAYRTFTIVASYRKVYVFVDGELTMDQPLYGNFSGAPNPAYNQPARGSWVGFSGRAWGAQNATIKIRNVAITTQRSKYRTRTAWQS